MKAQNNEVTISKDLLKFLMVASAYSEIGPEKQAYEYYDINHGIELLPKIEEIFKDDFSKNRRYTNAIDILCIPDYELDVNEEYHRKIR